MSLNDHNYVNETKHVEKHNDIVQEGNPFTIDISYSMVIPNNSKDHGGLGFSAKEYHPKKPASVVMKFSI